MVEEKNVIRGKKSRAAGSRFELKVRKDLEEKKWIVSKWMDNVDIDNNTLIPAKHKFRGKGIPMAIGTGFPDFICFKSSEIHRTGYRCAKCNYVADDEHCVMIAGRFPDGHWENHNGKELYGHVRKITEVYGVEVKSNGILSKIEKEKCEWLLENNIFSKIIIAKKGIKRGEILYTEFK